MLCMEWCRGLGACSHRKVFGFKSTEIAIWEVLPKPLSLRFSVLNYYCLSRWRGMDIFQGGGGGGGEGPPAPPKRNPVTCVFVSLVIIMCGAWLLLLLTSQIVKTLLGSRTLINNVLFIVEDGLLMFMSWLRYFAHMNTVNNSVA